MALAPAAVPASPSLPPARPVHYPDSDGKPIAENTLQFDWIVTIKVGLDRLFAGRADVFVAGDLLWYPFEGDNKTRVAPDTMVAFGRPRGSRGSYKQWEEGGVCPQVVFEVLSPGNTPREMARKLRFYEQLGVEEYYVLDPGPLKDPDRKAALEAWTRPDPSRPFSPAGNTDGWRSLRLGVLFEHEPVHGIRLVRPDGRPFETFGDVSARADAERQRADAATQRAETLLARLRAAGIDPENLVP